MALNFSFIKETHVLDQYFLNWTVYQKQEFIRMTFPLLKIG